MYLLLYDMIARQILSNGGGKQLTDNDGLAHESGWNLYLYRFAPSLNGESGN
jgi:hypothetical protein